MRTTVTLDPDAAALVERTMRERGMTFKEAINTAVRQALSPGGDDDFVVPTYSMGVPRGVDLDKAVRLAADLEDAEMVLELERGR